MGDNTDIQFADRTGNLEMGCGSQCELSPKPHEIVDLVVAEFAKGLPGIDNAIIRAVTTKTVEGRTSSELFHLRRDMVAAVLDGLDVKVAKRDRQKLLASVEMELKSLFVCFAHVLHLRFGGNPNRPDKIQKEGYAEFFEKPILTPGKVAEVVNGTDLFGTVRPDKPWLDYLPTIIFLGDMGDNFGPSTPFEYLKTEAIDVAVSARGSRCFFLWFTKQPRRMLDFAKWLKKQGVAWPENIMPVTSITSPDTLWRLRDLRNMPAKFLGVSLEPLWADTVFPLDGLSWVVCGGQSGWYRNKPFDLGWARSQRDRCQAAGIAFFMKQFGNAPIENETPLILKCPHGGDWAEFPSDLRVRQMPHGLHQWGAQQLFASRQQAVQSA